MNLQFNSKDVIYKLKKEISMVTFVMILMNITNTPILFLQPNNNHQKQMRIRKIRKLRWKEFFKLQPHPPPDNAQYEDRNKAGESCDVDMIMEAMIMKEQKRKTEENWRKIILRDGQWKVSMECRKKSRIAITK